KSIALKDPQFAKLLEDNWKKISGLTRIMIANVAGAEMASMIQQQLSKHWQCPIEFIQTSDHALGINNGYQNPQQLGVDRWLNLIAAKKYFPEKNLAIFSCGTCITLDVLTLEGQHLGGLIVPGIDLIQSA